MELIDIKSINNIKYYIEAHRRDYNKSEAINKFIYSKDANNIFIDIITEENGGNTLGGIVSDNEITRSLFREIENINQIIYII
jgi:hypothetical protein